MYERWRDQGAREKGEKIAGGKLFEMPKSNKIYEVTVPEHQINVGAYKSDQISCFASEGLGTPVYLRCFHSRRQHINSDSTY